jgi:hypothetical protein
MTCRTRKEIEEMTAKGEAFVKQSPRSMFGTDNTMQFGVFKRVMKRYLDGESITSLEIEADECEDFADEGTPDEAFYQSVQWLKGESDEMY